MSKVNNHGFWTLHSQTLNCQNCFGGTEGLALGRQGKAECYHCGGASLPFVIARSEIPRSIQSKLC